MNEKEKLGLSKDWRKWQAEDASVIAENLGILLNEDHWEIIKIVRNYYETYRLFPPNRVLINLIMKEQGPEKANSIHLMQLFSGTPAKVLAQIAGLPKPANCD
mgnify:CR=1 FL=1|tara:strand:+ start:956 stop:1264 length:309 start_codon:yes stop_codon:yes gene_type:complete